MTTTYETRTNAQQAEDNARDLRIAQVRDQVSCPTCKAERDQPCEWGTTNTGGNHASRIHKAEKATTQSAQAERGTDDMTTTTETNLTADRILLNRYHVTTRKALIAAIRAEQFRETGEKVTLNVAAVLLDRFLDAENEKIASGAYDTLAEQRAQFEADYDAAVVETGKAAVLSGIMGILNGTATAETVLASDPMTAVAQVEYSGYPTTAVAVLGEPITGTDESVPAAVIAKKVRKIRRTPVEKISAAKAKITAKAPLAVKVYRWTARNGSKMLLTNRPVEITCETHEITATYSTVRAAAAAGHSPATFCPTCAVPAAAPAETTKQDSKKQARSEKAETSRKARQTAMEMRDAAKRSAAKTRTSKKVSQTA